MKRLLFLSILLNVLLLAGMVFSLQRLGGWKYMLTRLGNPMIGQYHHRQELFERLPAQRGAAIMLGDSQIEQCEWGELLSGDSLRVLNRGISGDYVAGVQSRLAEVLRHQPRSIYLLVGVNDLFFQTLPGEVAAQYRELVQRIRRESPNTELVLMTLPPVNNQLRNTRLQNTDIQALNAQIVQIAHDYALRCLDLYPLLTNASGNLSARFSEDGVHLNGAGYAVIKSAMD
ncbi:MAG TPA: GDSL-type esterase/lipase family protein [Saprospiraceae bacterium]|nr:GDSL-type esterase/lipase family protein [Saprospiraceae bacterium]HNG90085.1 GDSL-type esterase/lipase family protein [Saprospiraceae bacterium]